MSRRDLPSTYLREDDDIRAGVRGDVLRRVLLTDPDAVEVVVDEGVVTLTGTVDAASDHRADPRPHQRRPRPPGRRRRSRLITGRAGHAPALSTGSVDTGPRGADESELSCY